MAQQGHSNKECTDSERPDCFVQHFVSKTDIAI